MSSKNKTRYEKFFPIVLCLTIFCLIIAGLYIFGFRFYYTIPEADANLASFLSGVASIVATFWLVFAVFIQMEGLKKTQEIAKRAIELEELNQVRESVHYYQTHLRPNSSQDILDFESSFEKVVKYLETYIKSRFIDEHACPKTISKYFAPDLFQNFTFEYLPFKLDKVEGNSSAVGVYRLSFDLVTGCQITSSELSLKHIKSKEISEPPQREIVTHTRYWIKYEFYINNPISLFNQNVFSSDHDYPPRISRFIDDTRSLFEILKQNDSSHRLGDNIKNAERYLTANQAIDFFVNAAGLIDAAAQLPQGKLSLIHI